nr:hypothetical protein GCM10020185_47060 [Pseudomonas brassicacearum subsp. brassicacearum]
MQRDGYGTAKVHVKIDNDKVYASISGVPKSYGQPLKALLDAGDLAYNGASKLNSDKKWSYNWYLFLPLGMALEKPQECRVAALPAGLLPDPGPGLPGVGHHRPLGHAADRQRHCG